MKSALLILMAVVSLTIATHASEIQVGYSRAHDPIITLTGKLGSYNDPGEDGFTITITSGDVAVPRDPADWPIGSPKSLPVKRVAISDFNHHHPELKKAAAEGKTVTLRGSLSLWERHIKLSRSDVLIFQLE